AFIFATSTRDGHSLLQALQLRHKSITSLISSWSKRFSFVELVKNCRSILARARVVSFSSRVAINDGHMVPPVISVFRQSPEPEHFSAIRRIPSSWVKSK